MPKKKDRKDNKQRSKKEHKRQFQHCRIRESGRFIPSTTHCEVNIFLHCLETLYNMEHTLYKETEREIEREEQVVEACTT